MARKRGEIKSRLLSKIKESNSGCWIWQGCKHRDGYGVIGIGRKGYRVHRVSYEAFNGSLPENMLVCHSCDVPLCINPAHLFLGTPRDNTLDMFKKGRKKLMIDTEHPNTKIPHCEREKIIKRRKNGEYLKSIAKDYGVNFQTISAICLGVKSYGAR